MAHCCIIEVEDPPTMDISRTRRARKAHVCCECGDTIEAGSLYQYTDNLTDEKWRHYKTCARCENVASDFFPRGRYYGNLVQDFYECFGFDYRDGIPEDFAPCSEPGGDHGAE